MGSRQQQTCGAGLTHAAPWEHMLLRSRMGSEHGTDGERGPDGELERNSQPNSKLSIISRQPVVQLSPN